MSKMFLPAAMVGLAALSTRAEAEDLASEFVTVAGLAASTFPVDRRLAELLTVDPLSLPPLEQTYEIVDFESYADPTTATLQLTTGAILLVDPSETGEFVRYRYRHPDGSWVRDAEGRFLTSSWYQTPDGRISKVIRNADGKGVGTYTVDPVLGGYELALDLDADRVVDVQDIVTRDGHEQVSSTVLGRDWVALFLEGYNAMCYAEVDSGMPGMSDFGSLADERTSFGACNLSRGGRAGGFSGSLDQAPTDVLEGLCGALSTPEAPKALQELRDRLADSRRGDCVDDCMVDYTVCLGHCATEGPLRSGEPPSPADAVCVVFCSVEAVICMDRCGAEVDEAGEIMVPPDPQPTIPESGGSGEADSGPYYDMDGDGSADSEDTDDDGTPDLTCGSPGCGAEAYPNPYDDVIGDGWDDFCRRDDPEREDRWRALEDAASDCPPLKEDGKGSERDGFDAFFDCLAPPKEVDMDDPLHDAWGLNCAESERGCEPKTLAEKRARFMAANNATMAFVLDCGDDLLCQPVPK